MKNKPILLPASKKYSIFIAVFIPLLIGIFLFSFYTQKPKRITENLAAIPGDCEGQDVDVDILDFQALSNTFAKSPGDTGYNAACNFNSDPMIEILDYQILSNNFGRTGATNTPTTSVTQGPTTSPPPPGTGIWISREEIMRLPTSGSAWNNVKSHADSNWGSACLYDNNCLHDINTLAGALVAVRLNDSQMRNKVITGIQSAMNSSLSRALELSRGLQSYIIAADIIGYRTPEFESWVRRMLDANVSGHSGGSLNCNSGYINYSGPGGGVVKTALIALNNWGGHARASLTAASLYLNDTRYLNEVVNAHKTFIGISVPNHTKCESTTWHATTERFGVNRKGSIRSGINISGILPEDWRRADFNFNWPPTKTGYMWEGMQGFVATAAMLHRANLVPFSSGDNAVVRAMDILYARGEAASNSPQFTYPAEGDDSWIPWLVNFYAGTNYPASSTVGGKGIAFTDWTHN